MLHRRWIISFEHVHQHPRRLRVTRLAGVISGMTIRRTGHLQPALTARQIGTDIDPLIDVVVDHPEVVVPE